MTNKEKIVVLELWTRFRECLVHASATPKLIQSWEEKMREVLK